jgi:hypothetical protein
VDELHRLREGVGAHRSYQQEVTGAQGGNATDSRTQSMFMHSGP